MVPTPLLSILLLPFPGCSQGRDLQLGARPALSLTKTIPSSVKNPPQYSFWNSQVSEFSGLHEMPSLSYLFLNAHYIL